jgi:hypothetical protein
MFFIFGLLSFFSFNHPLVLVFHGSVTFGFVLFLLRRVYGFYEDYSLYFVFFVLFVLDMNGCVQCILFVCFRHEQQHKDLELPPFQAAVYA